MGIADPEDAARGSDKARVGPGDPADVEGDGRPRADPDLDESIEIFNRVDDAIADFAQGVHPTSGDSTDKTEQVASRDLADYAEDTKPCSDKVSVSNSLKEPELKTEVNSRNSSSDEESESPLVSDSESSASKSVDNTPSHFVNHYASSTVTDTDRACRAKPGEGPQEPVELQDGTSVCISPAARPEVAPSQNGLEGGNHPESLHSCFDHPQILTMRQNYEEMIDKFETYKDKAARLGDCLADLEKMMDKVGMLERKLCEEEVELEVCRTERDAQAKALATLRQESSATIESLKKKYEQANKEKEGMVMRYAKSEKELLDVKGEKTGLVRQLRDQQREGESVLAKLRLLSEDRSRLAVSLDNKSMELSSAHKEIDKLKEDINSRDIKIKWIQNKLIGEMDLHKECPEKIDKLHGQLAELEKTIEKDKVEIEQCRKAIQELEAIKVLEDQVKEEQAKLILERHDQSERVIRMKALQLKSDALVEQNNNLTVQVQRLESEKVELEKELSGSRRKVDELTTRLADLSSRVVELESVSTQLALEKERMEKADEEVERLRRANEELGEDSASCRAREAELLSFTQQLTAKTVRLQSDFSSIESRAGELMLEAEKAETTSDSLRRELKMLKEELETERSKREEERNLLAREVAEARSRGSQLDSQLSEARSALSSSNSKHQALIRELQRELQGCYKRLEQEGRGGSAPSERGASSGGSSPTGRGTSSSPGGSSVGSSVPDTTVLQPSHLQLEVSPAILVERILKLQTDSKNYQDKIEFLEDHNSSLVEELKKKRKLLQSYILREQAGALASQASDNNKVEMTKHGGIMASLYGSRPSDDGITLELSLEISHKLQTILEDTLLKNITLKENIDTLGDEIERLKKHS